MKQLGNERADVRKIYRTQVKTVNTRIAFSKFYSSRDIAISIRSHEGCNADCSGGTTMCRVGTCGIV